MRINASRHSAPDASCMRGIDPVYTLLFDLYHYGVAMVRRLLQNIGLFCRISSLLYGSFAKESYNFKGPTNHSHSIAQTLITSSFSPIWVSRGCDIRWFSVYGFDTRYGCDSKKLFVRRIQQQFVRAYTWMRHVTLSWTSHVTHTNESCQRYERVMSHV